MILSEIFEKTAKDLTEDELALLLAHSLGLQDEFDAEWERKIFESLKGTDGFMEYLRVCAARDKDRYFGAAKIEEQLIIRGAFARTMYLKSRLSGDTTKSIT